MIIESNMFNLIKVCPLVVISLCYCYWIRRLIPAGKRRLFSLLPIIFLNLFIPLTFSSVHLAGTAGFFFAWLANFKLLLFAFNKGPLSSDPSISLGRFIALACLPIKIQQNPPPDPSKPAKSSDFDTKPTSITPNTSCECRQKLNPIKPNKGYTPFLEYAIKGILLAVLVKTYEYSDHIHRIIILLMYCFHIYFLLEILLAIVAALARTTLGVELEPHFNDPILSTSLQDFWGRRWNLMVTSILRPTVYEPILKAARDMVGPKWAPLPAVLATFVVSGLMHELILFYMGRLEPTFKMMGFFVLHGMCLMVEMALKKALPAKCRLPRFVSAPLTVGFFFATCFWLFLPEFIRCRVVVKFFEEYAALGLFVKNLTSAFRNFVTGGNII